MPKGVPLRLTKTNSVALISGGVHLGVGCMFQIQGVTAMVMARTKADLLKCWRAMSCLALGEDKLRTVVVGDRIKTKFRAKVKQYAKRKR